ncbi:phospholipase D family protein [Anaerostipes sp.]|uniref:phospholipase D family protein n=1 Tax=Anaerostipes sp. TaxID=1872530 RepID=UPI0025BC974D|nr:phospholipase D family protein [Anaerostipes sp.]MBS7007758.1 phospholipase D family protein [Anaerostipes sp.]
MKKKKSTILKRILFLILIVILYEAVGACLPFAFQKPVSDSYKNKVDVSAFRGTGKTKERAGIVETNKGALDTRLAMIREAKKSIVISTFDIREGKSTDDTFAALLDAAGRGVKVQILVDGLYGMLHMNGKTVFQAAGSHPNLEIKFYNEPDFLKPWTINGRLHDKYVVADGSILLMGGRNMFDYFIGDDSRGSIGYDREVLLYSQNKKGAIPQVLSYFQKLWESSDCKTVFNGSSSGKKVKTEIKYLSSRYEKIKKQIPEKTNWAKKTIPVKKASFVTNPTHIGNKEPYVWYTMQQLMLTAKKDVTIQTPYAVFSKDMYQGMEELTSKVPSVEMLVNSTAAGDNFIASSDYTMNRPKVLKTGAQVYEFFGDHSCHGKSIAIDNDLSVIGSYNFDMRSTYLDTETMLILEGQELNRELRGHMDRLKSQSLQVNADGTYVPKQGVHKKELTTSKKLIFRLSSVFLQLFRYLA